MRYRAVVLHARVLNVEGLLEFQRYDEGSLWVLLHVYFKGFSEEIYIRFQVHFVSIRCYTLPPVVASRVTLKQGPVSILQILDLTSPPSI